MLLHYIGLFSFSVAFTEKSFTFQGHLLTFYYLSKCGRCCFQVENQACHAHGARLNRLCPFLQCHSWVHSSSWVPSDAVSASSLVNSGTFSPLLPWLSFNESDNTLNSFFQLYQRGSASSPDLPDEPAFILQSGMIIIISTITFRSRSLHIIWMKAGICQRKL